MTKGEIKKAKIEVYITTDGIKHISYEEAQTHQAVLDDSKVIDIKVYDIGYDGVFPIGEPISVRIFAKQNHKEYAELIAQELFGNRVVGNIKKPSERVWVKWEIKESVREISTNLIYDVINGGKITKTTTSNIILESPSSRKKLDILMGDQDDIQ